jgi:hypothetical protein
MCSAQDRPVARDARFGIFDSLATSFPTKNLGRNFVLPGIKKKVKIYRCAGYRKSGKFTLFSHLTRAMIV